MTGETSGLFRAIAQFLDAEGRPLSGRGWLAKVFDADCLTALSLAVHESLLRWCHDVLNTGRRT